MAIIHIQETTSTQVTELIKSTAEEAIMAYAHNAAFDWDQLISARFRYFPGDKVIRRAVFEFNTERLIVRHEISTEHGHRYIAAWLNQN